MSEPHRQRTLYGRRQGPRLRPGRRRLLDETLPELAIRLPPPGGRLEPSALLAPGTDRLWLEIGFGSGEHLVAQAECHRTATHLGVEPFLNGVANLLTLVESRSLGNVRVLVDDARLLLDALPDACLERVTVLFADPWPKLRHHKRRLVTRATVAAFARVMRVGGELRLASDHAGYVTWMLVATLAEPRFAWLAEQARDWQERPADWPPTRYEAKARAAGRRPSFLRFQRQDTDDWGLQPRGGTRIFT